MDRCPIGRGDRGKCDHAANLDLSVWDARAELDLETQIWRSFPLGKYDHYRELQAETLDRFEICSNGYVECVRIGRCNPRIDLMFQLGMLDSDHICPVITFAPVSLEGRTLNVTVFEWGLECTPSE